MSRWKWQVSCYYGETVQPPKRPGDLAIQTVHMTDSSKDLEVEVANEREDIGDVVVTRYHDR